MSLLSYSLWASSGTKWSFTARRQWKMFLEIHVIYLKIILGKQLIYKIEDWLLDKKTHCWLNPESSKHNVYLAEVEHPTEIPDDARHFCNFLSAFFKLSSHTIASAYVSTHLQTTKQSKKRSHVHSCLRQWKSNQQRFVIMFNAIYDTPKLNRTFLLNYQYFWLRYPIDAGLANHGHYMAKRQSQPWSVFVWPGSLSFYIWKEL